MLVPIMHLYKAPSIENYNYLKNEQAFYNENKAHRKITNVKK